MELTQEEIKWIKDRFAESKTWEIANSRNAQIEEARSLVAKKYEAKLNRLAEEEKFDERKALVEIMVKEADEAESKIIWHF